jgi:hypothetical protein
MQFFLYEIVARIVAIWVGYSCGRTLWNGLTERKIQYYNDDFIDGLFVDWSKVIADRERTPVRYWLQIVLWTFAVLGCLGVAIFGWWHPNS